MSEMCPILLPPEHIGTTEQDTVKIFWEWTIITGSNHPNIGLLAYVFSTCMLAGEVIKPDNNVSGVDRCPQLTRSEVGAIADDSDALRSFDLLDECLKPVGLVVSPLADLIAILRLNRWLCVAL